MIYRPVAQASLAESQFAIRVNGDPAAFAQTVRAQFETIDPLLPPFGMMSLSDAIHESFAGSSQIVGMMAILGILALVIAIVGVYGVVAYAVAERMHEFGIRMALGAQRRDIFLLVMRRGALLAGVRTGHRHSVRAGDGPSRARSRFWGERDRSVHVPRRGGNAAGGYISGLLRAGGSRHPSGSD